MALVVLVVSMSLEPTERLPVLPDVLETKDKLWELSLLATMEAVNPKPLVGLLM